jgi:MFS family permease
MVWLTVPIAVVVFSPIAMREPPRSGVSIAKPSGSESFREVWRYRATIAPLLAGMVLMEMAVCAVLTWASPTFSRIFTLAPDRVGAIMMVTVSLGGIVGSIVGGILADLCQRTAGPSRTVFVASWLAVASVPAASFGVQPGVALASAFLVTFMAIVSAAMVMGLSLFTIVIPNELRGLCMASIAAGQVLFGVGLAPVLVSLLSGALGGPDMIGKALAVFSVTACMLAAAAFASGTHFLRTVQMATAPVLAGPIDATDR